MLEKVPVEVKLHMSKEKSPVCPASGASFLLIGRRLLHNPDKILGRIVSQGQTVLDIGCGPGFFSLAMARLVGESGKVIAADLQQEMLDIVHKRACEQGLESRIQLHKCESDGIGLSETVDFALAFYMVHEVPDPEKFLREVYETLKPGGQLLFVEPKGHVSGAAFESSVKLAQSIGFEAVSKPGVLFSRARLFKKS